MKRTQIYPFRANPTKCNNQYQNVQINAPLLRPAAVPVHSFPGFSDILPRPESFFLLNNWTFEYILHFFRYDPGMSFLTLQSTGYPFCVISIRPICTPPEKRRHIVPGPQIRKSFMLLRSSARVSVSYHFVSVSVLAATDFKWYDKLNYVVYP